MEFAREFEKTSGSLPQVLKDQFGDSGHLVGELGRWFAEPSADRMPCFLDSLVELAAAERAFLLHRDDQGEWECPLARDLDRENVRQPLSKVLLPLAERTLESADLEICDDVAALPDRDRWDRENLPRTRSVMVIPLQRNSLIYIDHRFQNLQTEVSTDFIFGVVLAAIQQVISSTGNSSPSAPAEIREVTAEVREPQNRPEAVEIIGEHPELLAAKKLIDKVAPSMAPILVTGESGTGKELAARSVHDRSPRADGPFVSENCGAITETLLETELFGCVKGAYTGATEDRPGLFELAHGGTIFLDEIGDTSPGLQKKLLRVIQEGVIRRVGGQELIHIDVRIVSATNRDLATEVQQGRFREDLFYRLNVINVHLPPLRDRGSDVTLIAQRFLDRLNDERGSDFSFDQKIEDYLLSHSWPGNIRQLQNEIRRIHALASDRLDVEDFTEKTVGSDSPTHSSTSAGLDSVIAAGSMKSLIEDLEKQWIAEALEKFGDRRGEVCKALGIPKTTLYAKMKRYGLGSQS
jgi:transcriptional regulator with PAS, ATPase and Fis domain